MTKETYDLRDLDAAWDRLWKRYKIDIPAGAFDRLGRSLWEHARHADGHADQYTEKLPTGELHDRVGHRTFPEPTAADLIDGLTLVDRERRSVDQQESDLIDAAVAAGVSWQQIGIALGHTADTAERAAKVRRAYLKRQLGTS